MDNEHTVVVVSGGFDPIHSGHLRMIREAKSLGDILVVGVNSDDWLIRKKGKAFLDFNTRVDIIRSLSGVDLVTGFNDSDGSAKSLLKSIKSLFYGSNIIFANGGDRNKNNIPEMDVDDVEFVFGIGGEFKANSSSLILRKWEEKY